MTIIDRKNMIGAIIRQTICDEKNTVDKDVSFSRILLRKIAAYIKPKE